MPKATFEEWMKLTDMEVDGICGLSTADLPDCDYWNYWNDGLTPNDAALKAIEYAGGF